MLLGKIQREMMFDSLKAYIDHGFVIYLLLFLK